MHSIIPSSGIKITVTFDNVYITVQSLAFITERTSSMDGQAVMLTADVIDNIVNVKYTFFEV